MINYLISQPVYHLYLKNGDWVKPYGLLAVRPKLDCI